MTISYSVQPQRSNGRGFEPCELHQATSFAVIKTEKYTSRGRKFTHARMIARFASGAEAIADMERREKNMGPFPRAYKLGKRLVGK